uniref:Secreted protein n=1 Tax=Triticum urartu TaxID=4572 RepID=A0A8R7RCE2_TRIUA
MQILVPPHALLLHALLVRYTSSYVRFSDGGSVGRRWRGGRDDFTAFHDDEEGGFGTGKGSVGNLGGSRHTLAGAVVAESTPAAADADDTVVSSSTTIAAATTQTHRPPDLAMVDPSALSILIGVCVRGWMMD